MLGRQNKIKTVFFLGIALSILAGCGSGISSKPRVTEAPFAVVTTQEPFNITTTISLSPQISILSASKTLNPTQQAEQVIYQTETAESQRKQQIQDDNATKVAQFPVACDGKHSGNISPNERWLATSCGSKSDQTLIVQNREGAKWVLDFKDFLSPNSPAGVPGALIPKFWSPDGEYLYFISTLGYSGGGNDCFPWYDRGQYGLFRLNLKMGSWTTIIPATDSFPGYGIEFSPTGRRFAATINGVMITDLNTSEVTKIDVPGVVQGLSWSPDGIHLAYSAASCGEQLLQSSSAYIWDALTNQAQKLIATDEMLLRPELWSDNSTLRIEGEKYVSPHNLYTIYVYDISQDDLVFTGTATPYP